MPSKFRFFAALAAVCVFLSPAPALALAPVPLPPQPDPTADEREAPTRWYGWQTLITDGVALGSLAGFMATFRLCWDGSCDNTDAGIFLMTSMLSYGAGGPLIHGAHGRWNIAAASFGTRMAPFAGAAVLSGTNEDRAARTLFFGGVLAAMAVDSAVLAREPVREREPRTMILPSADLETRSGSITVFGRF